MVTLNIKDLIQAINTHLDLQSNANPNGFFPSSSPSNHQFYLGLLNDAEYDDLEKLAILYSLLTDPAEKVLQQELAKQDITREKVNELMINILNDEDDLAHYKKVSTQLIKAIKQGTDACKLAIKRGESINATFYEKIRFLISIAFNYFNKRPHHNLIVFSERNKFNNTALGDIWLGAMPQMEIAGNKVSQHEKIFEDTQKCYQRRSNGKFAEYELALMSEGNLKKENIIEINCEAQGLRYRVMGLDGNIKTDLIKWDDPQISKKFPHDNNKINNENKSQCLRALLSITSAAGYTPRGQRLGLIVSALEHYEQHYWQGKQGDYFMGHYKAVTPEDYKELNVNHVRLGIPDFTDTFNKKEMAKVMEEIEATRQSGESVYFHCKAGRGRGPLILMCYLMTLYKDPKTNAPLSYENAYQLIKTNRGHVSNFVSKENRGKRKVIEDFAKWFHDNPLKPAAFKVA